MAVSEQEPPSYYRIKIGPPVWPGPDTEFRLNVHNKGVTEYRIFDKDIHKFTEATGLQFPKGDDIQLCLSWKSGNVTIASFAPDSGFTQCTVNDYGLKELLPKAFFAEEWIWRDISE
jgi:hypothetical protein